MGSAAMAPNTDVESRYSGGCDSGNGGSSLTGECGPNFAGNKDCKGGVCCSEFKIEITHDDGNLFWALCYRILSSFIFSSSSPFTHYPTEPIILSYHESLEVADQHFV